MNRAPGWRSSTGKGRIRGVPGNRKSGIYRFTAPPGGASAFWHCGGRGASEAEAGFFRVGRAGRERREYRVAGFSRPAADRFRSGWHYAGGGGGRRRPTIPKTPRAGCACRRTGGRPQIQRRSPQQRNPVAWGTFRTANCMHGASFSPSPEDRTGACWSAAAPCRTGVPGSAASVPDPHSGREDPGTSNPESRRVHPFFQGGAP